MTSAFLRFGLPVTILACVVWFAPALALADKSGNTLVTPDWLNAHLLDPDLLIIDTREAIFYQQAHIPGAINIPVDATFALGKKNYRIGGLQQIKQLFSQHGIRYADHVIVYDDGRLIDAARFFWVLEVYGHQHVSLMDGGMLLWQRAGLPINTVIQQRPESNFIPTISHQRLTTKIAMQIALGDPTVQIIDARSREEYHGTKSIAERAGHIPGAVNIPWLDNMQAEHGINKLLSNGKLVDQYQAYKDKPVITYCNRGKQSALTYFALRTLGYNVSVYDGAWLEWANDENLPIE